MCVACVCLLKVRREARLPDMAPISRGGAYARLHASSSTAGVDVRAWETSADESLLGLAATEDPLLIGAKSLKAEERAHWHAKSTLVSGYPPPQKKMK